MTYYYQQIAKIVNGDRQVGDNSGQFIYFTNKLCYDSDKDGYTVNNGVLEYIKTDNNIIMYYGDTYWGKAYYFVASDYSRINIKLADRNILIYERRTAKSNTITSSKRKTKEKLDNIPINPINPAITDTQYDKIATCERLQQRYNTLKQRRDDAERDLNKQRANETLYPDRISGSSTNLKTSTLQLRMECERQMADIRREAIKSGCSVY